jgi:hypothetical protein
MRQVISVEKIMVGTRSDFEGVVLVLNHEQPEEILFALTPEWAIRIADARGGNEIIATGSDIQPSFRRKPVDYDRS